MSVLACDRGNCPNIMCDRLILQGTRDGSRYICNSCYDELLEFKKTWEPPMTAQEVEAKIREFMATNPGAYRVFNDEGDIDAEFDKLTGKERDHVLVSFLSKEYKKMKKTKWWELGSAHSITSNPVENPPLEKPQQQPSQQWKLKKQTFVIVLGTTFSEKTIHGPFEDRDHADQWIASGFNLGLPYEIVPMVAV